MKKHKLTINEYVKLCSEYTNESQRQQGKRSRKKLTDKDILINQRVKESRYRQTKYNKEELLELIKQFHTEHGRWPKVNDFSDKKSSIISCFGSMLAAIFEVKYGEPLTAEWLRTPQLAKKLGVSTQKIYEFIRAGELEAEIRKVGNYYFIRISNGEQ